MYAPTVTHLRSVSVAPVSTAILGQVIERERYAALSASIVHARAALKGRAVWNVSSNPCASGVAEMLKSTVAYALGSGIDTRWMTIQAQTDFFAITKRIQNRLRGYDTDNGDLSKRERYEYERFLAPAALELATMVNAGDVVLLHDALSAGLAPELKRTGAKVLWRSHFAIDTTNSLAHDAWNFLMPYLAEINGYVFPRAKFVPADVPRERATIIPPSIDPVSPKNHAMTRAQTAAVLIAAGLMDGYAAASPLYFHPNGTIGLVLRRAEVVQLEPLVPWNRIVLQVSRWDRSKDVAGVMSAFGGHVAPSHDCHLLLAGPEVTATADDPDSADALNRLIVAWEGLPEHVRRRIHLAVLPNTDSDETAAIVNAMQRGAVVIVQKSLMADVGMTVTEAMWKARPVVASRLGGLDEEIQHERSGLLLDDPTDLAQFGSVVNRLLEDPDTAEAIGHTAKSVVGDAYLADRELERYGALLSRIAC